MLQKASFSNHSFELLKLEQKLNNNKEEFQIKMIVVELRDASLIETKIFQEVGEQLIK